MFKELLGKWNINITIWKLAKKKNSNDNEKDIYLCNHNG